MKLSVARIFLFIFGLSIVVGWSILTINFWHNEETRALSLVLLFAFSIPGLLICFKALFGSAKQIIVNPAIIINDEAVLNLKDHNSTVDTLTKLQKNSVLMLPRQLEINYLKKLLIFSPKITIVFCIVLFIIGQALGSKYNYAKVLIVGGLLLWIIALLFKDLTKHVRINGSLLQVKSYLGRKTKSINLENVRYAAYYDGKKSSKLYSNKHDDFLKQHYSFLRLVEAEGQYLDLENDFDLEPLLSWARTAPGIVFISNAYQENLEVEKLNNFILAANKNKF